MPAKKKKPAPAKKPNKTESGVNSNNKRPAKPVTKKKKK